MGVPKVEVVLLGLLEEAPAYGYELLERVRGRGMDEWVEIGKASAYQALRRLEQRRFVSGRPQEGAEGPDRRVYRITPAGRSRLRAGLRERFGGDRAYEVDASLALGFAHLLPAEEIRRGIAAREAAIAARRRAIAEAKERAARASGPGRAAALRLLDEQDAFARAEQAWLAAFVRDLGRLRR